MEQFKQRWEIQENWQLLFPFLGFLGLFYSSYKITGLFREEYFVGFKIAFALLITFFLVRLCLLIFKKLEQKWVVKYRWEMIRIFIVFAITGSSSLFVGRPVIQLLGITKENLNIYVYWILYIIIGLIFYQILLVSFGYILGQGKFFSEFEKKMIRRFGLGRFVD
ncbi:hypothetical protein N7U66_01030 [Lacinutrix neustonica]|uniref:DUF6787 domain-containing protein n=1 Tax=Lacinutrix neustonica TaxID=2980107 RepID=A0A9E8MWJ7_9FLAO|nr:DUF6787 family protein [Lacinutrix neustonica]WAC02356.1 hypothetical protein N7U66_01030 [Lacinutrix neustonica]